MVHLIGLNTAIFSSSGSSAGVGFAVPADDIRRLIPQLIQHGRVRLAGIGFSRVPPHTAAQLGVKQGVLIGAILPHSPAEKAHLQGTYRTRWGHIHLGDIVIALNHRPVHNYDDLYNVLIDINVGDFVKITLLRDGKTLTLSLKTIDISSY